MILEMNSLKTILLAVILVVFGDVVRNKVKILVKLCIPSSVVGGLLFAILALVLNQAGIVEFKFDGTMQTFFMNIFFAASGCAAGLGLLKTGSKKVLIFVGLAALLAFLQNVLAVGVGSLLNVNPLIALMTGSIPMTGGHGNAASFGPMAEGFGATGALSVAVAAATFGLVTGSIFGGPIGDRIVKKHKIADEANDIMENRLEVEATENVKHKFILDHKSGVTAALIILASVGVGQFIFDGAKVLLPGVTLPIHVMCMLGGLIVRNLYDVIKKPKNDVLYELMDIYGEIALAMFVTMAIMTMKLWELAGLAGPLLILLAAQVVLAYIFVTQVTYKVMGRDYDAAIMAVGHFGFGMGAVPVSMTTMKTVCDKYKMSKLAFFVVPIVGGLFSNFTNAAIITAFLNFFK